MSKLMNRKAVRERLLQERRGWKPEEKRRNVSAEVLDEIEKAFERLVIAWASRDFAGRKGN